MDDVEVLTELARRLFKDVPSVHVDVRWQPALVSHLVQTDIKTVELSGWGCMASQVMEPDARDD
jgi:hypothetical protein